MGRLFHPESPLMRFLGNLTDLIALNLIWLICCVPIVTIGPSTTAMYCVARDIDKGEYPPVLRTFFREFRSNFKQSLLVFLVLLIPMLLVGAYLLMVVSGGLDHIPLIKYLCYVAIVIIGFVCSYAYPLLACFDNTVGNTLKNAILLPLANPFLALVVTALNMLPILVLLINPELLARCLIFWLVIGSALTALVNIKMLGSIFRRFVPPEEPSE